ncbi:hypothetical protein H1S01_03150 [Heliobacterium chlorum]|uniref:Uncharacterized protein n=1 Tax=Heliobacterium chlorum TaxID=2698 RepID=A0ABR7SY97_HELCL|nr:hypothetical protein [Heliobacterium chlorum]MBC9783508.1 hypothetical protein [Heliobacterium chlorum]
MPKRDLHKDLRFVENRMFRRDADKYPGSLCDIARHALERLIRIEDAANKVLNEYTLAPFAKVTLQEAIEGDDE